MAHSINLDTRRLVLHILVTVNMIMASITIYSCGCRPTARLLRWKACARAPPPSWCGFFHEGFHFAWGPQAQPRRRGGRILRHREWASGQGSTRWPGSCTRRAGWSICAFTRVRRRSCMSSRGRCIFGFMGGAENNLYGVYLEQWQAFVIPRGLLQYFLIERRRLLSHP